MEEVFWNFWIIFSDFISIRISQHPKKVDISDHPKEHCTAKCVIDPKDLDYSSPKYGPDHILLLAPLPVPVIPDLNLKIRGVSSRFVWRMINSEDLILDFIFRISLDLHILKTLRTLSLCFTLAHRLEEETPV